jgi:hypothetical protein
MVKFRIESRNHSKYFREEENVEAEKYFKSRVILGIPVEFWVVNISLFANTQVLIKTNK